VSITWQATVLYQTDTGLVDVTHDLDEIYDLGDLIEQGPHFDTVSQIVITRIGHVEDPAMTVEQAARL
jgi:hypothetical protein